MRIALATCSNLPAWEVDDAPFHRELVARGVALERPVWDDPAVEWGGYAACLIRTTWDYQEKREAFVAWADRVAAATRLHNPPAVVRWNTHKGYLRDLARLGVPIAPTVWLQQGTRVDVASLVRQRGWSRAFLKPCIGATARETLRFPADAAGLARAQAHVDRLLPREDLMLQPYLASVESRGEWSAVFFDGELSHAVQKVPVPGDYRVQDDFGASDRPYRPTPAQRQLAAAAVAAVWRRGGALPGADGAPLLYARADFLWDDAGGCVLTELEVVEPSLFFRHDAAAAGRLAAALLRRVAAG